MTGRTIAINGKFLGASLNGVHRTAAQFSSLLIEHARAAGHEVDLLAPRSFSDPEFPLLRPRVVKGRFGGGQAWEMLDLPRAARGKMLVNFCNLGPVAHRNSVVMIHDAQTFLYPEDYTGRQAAAYRLLLPLIGWRARHLLTVSEFSKHSLNAFRIGRSDRTSVVYNGTDHINRTTPDPSSRHALGLETGRYVMVLGTAKGYKNISTVFEACREGLPGGMRLAVVGGPGPEAYLKKGWTPPSDTVFTGFVSDGTLRDYYENACLFAFPSRTEGFGLPPVEAMHCGTPVISSNAGAMPEVCADAVRYVDPDDPKAWRRSILALIADQEARQAMALAGTARAAELNWSRAGARLWEVLTPLM